VQLQLFETGFVPEAGGEKKMNRKQAVYHTPLTIAAAKNFDKVVQDLLGIVLASTSARSRLYVTESLPLLVKEYPKHTTAFLNALELDRASAHVEPWRQELGGRYKVRSNRSSFAFSKAAWHGTEDDKKGSGVTTTLRTLSKCIPNSSAELPVVPKVVGLEGIATNTALLSALCESKHLDLFETKVVQALLEWKWQHHGWGMHTTQFALYVLFVLLYSLWLYGINTRYAHWVPEDHGGDMKLQFGGRTWREFQRGALPIALLFLGNEAVQIRAQGGRNYAAMGWNWIELATLVMPIHQMCDWELNGQLPMWTAQDGQMSGFYGLHAVPSSAVYTACTALLVYIRLLSYLRGYRPTAALVTMLTDVARDIVPFLTILLIVMLGFSSALFLLGEFKTPWQAGFSTFTIMLGEFYLDDDHRFNDTIVVQLFFIVFVLLVLIMMFNLLIAIISDTFERVIEKQNARFWQQLAILIRDLELLLALAPPLRLHRPSHQWLHALVPMEQSLSADDQWSGRVRYLTDRVDAKVDGVKAQVDEVKAQVKAQVDQVKAQVDEVKAQVDEVNAKVDQVLELLAKQA
jgi:hypothetical protein